MDQGIKKYLCQNTGGEVLDKVVEYRGHPRYIRCDNGPEFISQKLVQWTINNQVEIKFIQPGKPSQHGLVERLNKTLGVECLNLHWFENLQKLNESILAWSVDYNTERPHENLKRQTPLEYEIDYHDLYFKAVA